MATLKVMSMDTELFLVLSLAKYLEQNFIIADMGGHDTLLVHWVCYTNEPSATGQPEYFHPSFSFSILIPKEDIDKYSSFKLLDK